MGVGVGWGRLEPLGCAIIPLEGGGEPEQRSFCILWPACPVSRATLDTPVPLKAGAKSRRQPIGVLSTVTWANGKWLGRGWR